MLTHHFYRLLRLKSPATQCAFAIHSRILGELFDNIILSLSVSIKSDFLMVGDR
jgi:hypothetical protein